MFKKDIRSSNAKSTIGNDVKSKHYFLKIAILLALSYWFFDSTIHYFLYGELEFEVIPSAFNELWMRSTILILLVAFGIFADYHANEVKAQEAEKYAIYKTMLDASNHILRNFLTKMQLFRIKMENNGGFDQAALQQQDAMIDDAIRQLENLEKIQAPSKSIIEERYKPR